MKPLQHPLKKKRMNRDSVLSVYSDARAEYTKQLCVFLVPAFFQFFTDLLEKSRVATATEPKKVLWQFQTYLNEIHDWNMEKVNQEIHLINTNSGCDYLEDLLTAVFIAHTKVLTAIRLSSNNKKVEINIPKVDHFLFKVLCETAKLLWSSTYLFRDGIPGIERQQNYRNVEGILNEGILQAIRALVPVKSILKDFVTNDVSDIGGDKDDSKKKEDESDSDDETDTAVNATAAATVSAPIKKEESIFQLPSILKPSTENPVITPVTPVTPVNTAAPTIVIDDKPSVTFGKFNSLFSSEDPENSEMLEEDEEDAVPALEILEGDSEPLSLDMGIEDLEIGDSKFEAIGSGDYEEL